MVRQFEFKIEFVSGISNAAADALSRFFIHGPEEEEDSEPGIVLNNVSLVQEQPEQVQEDERQAAARTRATSRFDMVRSLGERQNAR